MQPQRSLHFCVVSILTMTAFLVGGCAPIPPQTPPPPTPQAQAVAEDPTPRAPAAEDTSFFSGMEWENIGIARGGRSIAVAGSDSRPLEYYFGATGGGLWKTVDGGTTWEPVTDGQINSSSVGAVGVCETDPDIVYIGTGEVQLRGNIMPGDGVYKSTDAGETWTHIGLEEARNIGRVRIDPTNCDRVFAAVLGHYGQPNPERGIFRTLDGGGTWEKVLYRNEETGGVDLTIDPNNPQVIYASLWEAFRKPWALSSGGPGSGLFKSTDGGNTWSELTHNPGLIPEDTIVGKIGVTVSPADPNRVYTIVEADSGGVYRSDDGGATWTYMNDERKLRQRAFYYTRIYADPQTPDIVYVLNTGFYKSTDGGETFPDSLRIEVPHGDNHDLWIASNDPDRMINANDGGGNVSFNGGETWTAQDFMTAQFYNVFTTTHEPYHVCGAQQDNSTACTPGKDWDHLMARGPNTGYYYAVGGGESGWIAPDPEDPDLFYAGSYGGYFSRYNHETGQRRPINVWPENPMGYSSVDIRERFQWTFPIVFSKTDPDVLYTASQHLWRSTNGGQNWERISPDLTLADPETMGPSGGPITLDQTGVETFATIFTVAPSPHDGNVIWTGSDDGLVHITRDGGQSWQDVTPPGAPEYLKITMVEASPHNPGTAYMVGNLFLLGDFSPYVYRTDDYGQTWTTITNGIPSMEFVRSIREDIVRPGLLYAGTEEGVWVSFNNGANWQSLSLNLPNTQVPGLVVEENDLVIGTHGRSFWVMYDIGPLRQFNSQIAQSDAHLFDPTTAVRDIDRGATIYYYLDEPAEQVTLEILDTVGDVIRTFEVIPADTVRREGEDEDDYEDRQREMPPFEAGLNKFIWDLRYPGYVEFPDMILWAAGNVGPMAVPGTYQVRLTANGQTLTESFEVEMDPRLEDVTAADLQARFDLAMQVRDRVTDANEAILLIRGIKEQVDNRLANTDNGTIEQAAEALTDPLSEVEANIYQVQNRSNQDPLNFPIRINNKIAALLNLIEASEARPTDQMHGVFEYLSGRLEEELTTLNQTIESELPELNQLLAAEGMEPVTRTPLEVDPNALRGVGSNEEYKMW